MNSWFYQNQQLVLSVYLRRFEGNVAFFATTEPDAKLIAFEGSWLDEETWTLRVERQ